MTETATSKQIVRRVRVNRARSPQEALDATGRKQYTDHKVVDSMPRGEGDEVEVVFFKPDLSDKGDHISSDDLKKEFVQRILEPADPYSLAAVNEADPAFADEHPNGTDWKNADGQWCFATFYRWDRERRVTVNLVDYDWLDFWWLAGVRK